MVVASRCSHATPMIEWSRKRPGEVLRSIHRPRLPGSRPSGTPGPEGRRQEVKDDGGVWSPSAVTGMWTAGVGATETLVRELQDGPRSNPGRGQEA